jgi:hypothetical protein
VRRRISEKMVPVRERFEELLTEWVPDEEIREAWRAHMHHRATEPAEPEPIHPLVFRGVSEAGSEVEIRWRGRDELTVEVDGSLTERIAAAKDFSTTRPSFRFHLDGREFAETFAAPPEALDALDGFAAGRASPPWEHATELLADGLVDIHFALTPRGRRALARPS